jgi:hypothetical protein
MQAKNPKPSPGDSATISVQAQAEDHSGKNQSAWFHSQSKIEAEK